MPPPEGEAGLGRVSWAAPVVPEPPELADRAWERGDSVTRPPRRLRLVITLQCASPAPDRLGQAGSCGSDQAVEPGRHRGDGVGPDGVTTGQLHIGHVHPTSLQPPGGRSTLLDQHHLVLGRRHHQHPGAGGGQDRRVIDQGGGVGQPAVDAEHAPRPGGGVRRRGQGAGQGHRPALGESSQDDRSVRPGGGVGHDGSHLADRSQQLGIDRPVVVGGEPGGTGGQLEWAPRLDQAPARVVRPDHPATTGWVLVAVQHHQGAGGHVGAWGHGLGPHGPGRRPTLADAGRDAEPAQAGAGHQQAGLVGRQLGLPGLDPVEVADGELGQGAGPACHPGGRRPAHQVHGGAPGRRPRPRPARRRSGRRPACRRPGPPRPAARRWWGRPGGPTCSRPTNRR